MKGFTMLSAAAAIYALGASAQTQGDDDLTNGDGNSNGNDTVSLQSNCRNDICYSMAVPASTARNQTGNIYFQIYAPDTFSWVALGTGSSMANSNMFIIYQDGEGGVTLSGRQASGRVMPTVPESGGPDLELLLGSGVDDGFMTANIRCYNCESWKTSTLNFTSNATPMIGAWQEGDPLDSDSVDAQIGVHTGSPRIFELDIRQAQVVEDENPFTGDNAIPANASAATGGSNGSNDEADAEDDDDDQSAGAGGPALLSGSIALAVLCAGLPILAF